MQKASPSIKDVAVGDLERELATTRRMLERVPEEHFSWKPHEKSWSLAALATHLANLLFWQRGILEGDEFDLASVPASGAAAESLDELLDAFDENAAALKHALAETDEAALRRTWRLKRGDKVVFSRPRADVLRSIGISHMIHHRGQLSVYLRLLDVPVPSSYGPTADEGSGPPTL